MTDTASKEGKLTVPDEATQREVMKLWQVVVRLERQIAKEKPAVRTRYTIR